MLNPTEGLRPAGSWLWRGATLSRRIAAAMILSLLAIQSQVFLQLRFFSNPEFRLTGVRSLAERVDTVVREAFAVPADQRHAFLKEKSEGSGLRLTWSPQLPAAGPDESATPLAARFSATLRNVLGDRAKAIHIGATTIGSPFPVNAVRITIVPETVASRLSAEPVHAGEPDVLIPSGLRVWVQGQDGSWVGVEPIGFDDDALGASLPLSPLLVGGIIIAIASTVMARRLVAPLDRLVIAAERIGTAREPVRVETEGLYEFAAVARAFEDMQQRLLRFVDDRTQMLAAISHDLRSSLTRMRLAAEQVSGSEDREALSTEIDEMQSMVEATLAFASGEARMGPIQPTDIAALLISLVDEAADGGRVCDYQGPNHIETMAHPVSLKRAFWNLIDNAIKYGGGARVSLTVGEERLKIHIDDDGPGIPEASREDVFAPFRRLDPARTHTTPGTGLGLTIARDVIQSHGGTIALCNRASGGLSVTIELPLRSHA